MVKKIIYVLLLFSSLSRAQNGFFINGNDASLKVEPDAFLSVEGDFQNLDCDPTTKVRFNGSLYLTGNLVNNDSLRFTAFSALTAKAARLILKHPSIGLSTSTISGTVKPIFWEVEIDKSGGYVNLQTDVVCYDTLNFKTGWINMNGKNWIMQEAFGVPLVIHHPYIKNETPSGMFLPSAVNDLGKVIYKTLYPVGASYNPGNIGIQLVGPMPNGDTLRIIRGFAQQVNAAKTSILRYFDIYSPYTSTVNLNALSIKVNYFNNDLLYFAPGYLNLSSLKLFASPNADNNWSMLPSTVQNTLVTLPPLAGAMTASLSDLALPTIGLNSKSFRITIADPNCLTPPVSSLVLDTVHICAGNTLVLDAGNSGGSVNNWLWTTIPTSTTTLYTQTISVTPNASFQKYTVELKNSNGCVTKDTVVVAPTAPIPFVKYFNHLNSCLGDSIIIKDTVTITSGTFTNTWTFSDATTSNSQLNLFKKKFALAGNHTIQLTSTSNYGCTVVNTATNVIVYPSPSVAFTHSLNCGTGIVSFSNTSVSNFSSAVMTSVGSLWNLGFSPTNTVVGLTAAQNYSANGTYTIKLVSATSLGCKDSITAPIIIYPSNVTAFTKNNACLGDTVYFNNSTACNTGSCSYQWSFGDNTNSSFASPKKVYNTPGLFTVKLKVTNPLGCPDSLTKQVFVNPKPNAAFTGTNTICINNFAYFNNTSSITSGSITSYLWDFNNAVTSTSLNGASNFSVAGVYNVSLTATSDSGCVSTFIQPLNVRPQPVAQYVVNNACFGTPSQFVSTSSGTGLSYIWQYGNGVVTSTLTNASQNYTYPALGTYASSLIAINAWGCSDTATVSTNINPSPILALGGNVATCGTTYSINAGNPGSTYVWQPGNQTSQSIVVTTNGSYQVAVTNTNGCTAAQSVSVTLNTNVKPQLGNDTTVCGPRVLNAGYPLSNYLWNNALTTQTILATASGSFEVRVTDQNGCIGRDTINLIVNAPAQVSLGADYTNCKPKFGLVLTPTTTATTYSWSSGALTPSLTVTNNGPYWLQVTAANGCKARDTINVSFLQTPVANLGPDKSVCGSTLLDALNIGSNYLWSDNSTGQTLNVNTSGSYFVTITNPSNSCFQKDTINVSVNPLVNVFLGNDTTYCNNSSYVLNAGNAGATYSWTSGQTTPTISVASSGIYGVTVTNAGGCSASDFITVTLVGAPVVNLGSNIRYLCGNNNVPLGVANIGTINWSSNVGFTATSPSVTINQPGKYWVDVSNFGCTASDSVLVVTTTNTIQAIFLASTTDTINKPIQFVNLSQPLPTSNLWDFGDGLTSTDYSPLHTYYLPQTFSVTLEVSNGFCTDKLTKALNVIFRNGVPIIYQPTNKLEVLNFSVYPNPSNNYLQIDFALNDYAPIELQLFDLTGRIVAQHNDDSQMIYSTQLDIREFKNGLYILNVNAKSLKGNIRKTSKVVKID